MNEQLSIIPLGGVGDVTRNMYVYEFRNEMLIVDCGLGFADETMIGVDLLLPDISYILQSKKRIVGMFLSHGHEDHIGAVPYLLSQLYTKNQFPIYGTPLTAAFTNGKLEEFGDKARVTPVEFANPNVQVGSFKAKFIRVTHSVPDTSHIFIQTPAGNFYHGSDFKFDDTPWDKQITDYAAIEEAGKMGVTCLLSDCLGTERQGTTGTEQPIYANFEREIGKCKGKCLITTFASHIARLNQIIQAAQAHNRKVCFIGRSLLKAVDTGRRLGYLKLDAHMEVPLDGLKNYQDKDLVLIVAGSQGQENSAMARIVNGEHKEVKLRQDDTIIFSSDTIPGNEVLVNDLIDTIAKRLVRVVYSRIDSGFHVSGHGSQDELKKLISLVKPKKMLPIGGNFRHMALYKQMAEDMGYLANDVLLLEDGQEVVFANGQARTGRKIPVKQIYVDQISGGEVESFVLRDRQRLSEFGVVIVMVEVEAETGQIVDRPDIIAKGFTIEDKRFYKAVETQLRQSLKRNGRVTNWVYIRKLVGEVAERVIFKSLRRRPLVLPIVIEV